MALIDCPECKAQISDQAENCIHCGLPLKNLNSPSSIEPQTQKQQVIKTAKSRGVYIILALFFGFFGIHNFYAGYNRTAVCQLLIVLLLGWIIIGFVITFIWILIDLFTTTHDAAGDKMV